MVECEARCMVHLVRAAAIVEFPEDDPSEELQQLVDSLGADGRCNKGVSTDVKLPLCIEDVEETDELSLFEGGLLTQVCDEHARELQALLIDGRVCTGPKCCDEQGYVKASPSAARMVRVHVYLWEGEGRSGVAKKTSEAEGKFHVHIPDE